MSDTKFLTEIQKVLTDLLKDIGKRLEKADKKALAGPEKDVITLSCDGSILKNPGGRCAAGAVIQVPNNEPIEIAKFTPSTTNNEAEYDAIYIGLSELGQCSPPEYPVIIESDSKLIVDSLNGKLTLKEPRLIKKRDMILEVVSAYHVPITFIWKRRNSTAGLRRANDIAQLLNGVKPH